MRYCLRLILSFLLLFGLTLTPTLNLSVEAGTEKFYTVAVADFSNTSGSYLPRVGESASEILSVMLAQTDKFNIVEREKLQMLLTEQGFIQSGLVNNEQSIVQIGKLLGADYMITGSVVSYGRRKVKFSGYGLRTEKIVTEMTISLKVLDVASGKIEFASLYNSEVEEGSTGSLMTGSDHNTRTLLMKNLQFATEDVAEKILPEQEETEEVEISLTSEPSGADIEINGIYYGNTPLSIQLKPGIYQVTISLADYNPWKKKINAYEGLRVNAVLEHKPVEVEED